MNTNHWITHWDDAPVLMDLAFASRVVGLTVDRLRTLSREGKFPAFKIGDRDWRVEKDALLEWIKERSLARVRKIK